jgi:hypothetical protein
MTFRLLGSFVHKGRSRGKQLWLADFESADGLEWNTACKSDGRNCLKLEANLGRALKPP